MSIGKDSIRRVAAKEVGAAPIVNLAPDMENSTPLAAEPAPEKKPTAKKPAAKKPAAKKPAAKKPAAKKPAAKKPAAKPAPKAAPAAETPKAEPAPAKRKYTRHVKKITDHYGIGADLPVWLL